MSNSWIAGSAVIFILFGVCIGQFQQQNSYYRQPQKTRYQPPQQQQQTFVQQPNQYNQQPYQQQQYQQQYQPQPQQQEVQRPRQLQQASSGSCPERNGRFPTSQCDAYIECIDGVAEEKLCPEGLLFNPEARFNYPCGYPNDIKCEGRSGLQPARPTEDCPHQYGYFKIGDRTNCGKFMNCVEGRGFTFDCPEGLAYNPETYRCDWPDQVADCDAEAFLGFSCPTSNQNSFLNSESRFYRSPHDCQHYFICVENRPRLQNCGEGNAFSELINACDAAENVTGCEPPPSLNQDLQQLELDVPQSVPRTFEQQQNIYNQQQNAYHQQHDFGTHNQQLSTRNQQSARRNNQGSRQRFSSFK